MFLVMEQIYKMITHMAETFVEIYPPNSILSQIRRMTNLNFLSNLIVKDCEVFVRRMTR